MSDKKKIGFFKRIKMALLNLEDYIEFTVEKLGTTLFFAIKVSFILAIVSLLAGILFVKVRYGSLENMAVQVIPEFTYNDHVLEFTEDYSKDDSKVAVAYAMEVLEPNYRMNLPIGENNKEDLVNYIKENPNQVVTTSLIFAYFLERFISIYVWWLLVATLTSLIGWIVLIFSRIKMKYSGIYSLSIYASLLTIILTVIYQILNMFFGIYINMFDYLSIIISYIYITAAIYMIRSDLIKQQIELIKLATEQAKIKEEMEKEKLREEEEKRKMREEQEEKERKEREKEQDEDKPKIKDEERPPEEPDGSEI